MLSSRDSAVVDDSKAMLAAWPERKGRLGDEN